MTFSEFKVVYKMIISGNFNFIQAFPSLMEFVIVMFLTILMGRWFCGWLCAFGTYNDFIYLLSRKVFKVKFRVDEKVDAVLKYVKYLVLLFILIVGVSMGSNILEGTSPWDAFAQITNFSNVYSTLFIGFILLALITIGAFFIERFFCRYLCPLGAVFSIFSKIGIVKINKPSDKCGKCRACTNNCSMGIDLYKVNKVKGGDCINCLKCVEVCPRKNANVNIFGEDLDAKLASSVAMATFVGAYGITNAGSTIINNSNLLSNNSIASSNAVNSNASSEQANSNNSIGNITDKEGIDGSDSVINEENSNSVSKTEEEGTSFDSNVNEGSKNSESITNSAVSYKDGTYTGSGRGFKGGTTEVSVTVTNGKISDIEILSHGDTPRYFQRVSGTITDDIISKQSTSVDTVSGATYSCKGIISAVEDALSEAK